MKKFAIVAAFDDLGKAVKYITEINEVYTNGVAEFEKVNELLKQSGASVLELNKAKTDLEKKVDDVQKLLDASLLEVQSLSAKLDAQEKHGKEGIVVTVGKTNYTLIGDSFFYNGEHHTAEQLSADTEQLKKMVAKKSGALVLCTTE